MSAWEDCEGAGHVLYCPDCEPKAFACPGCDSTPSALTESAAATGCTETGYGDSTDEGFELWHDGTGWNIADQLMLDTEVNSPDFCTSLDAVQAGAR